MVDITTLMAGLAHSYDITLNITRALQATVSNIQNAEFRNQIAELINSLADQKIYLADLKNILHEKDKKIELLNKKLKAINSTEKPKFLNNIYRFEEDDGIYCCHCWDDDVVKSRVLRSNPNQLNLRKCPRCKTECLLV